MIYKSGQKQKSHVYRHPAGPNFWPQFLAPTLKFL